MVFTKHLREGVRRGRIRCSVGSWMKPHVKVGGRYPMDEGHIVVDSIESTRRQDITRDLARESGFEDRSDSQSASRRRSQLLRRIRYVKT